ncbi:hypothetical protein AB205_0154870 [Aquarana catesbeiana]|uniref:Uncharacterized protein n=1 Tax=Aquarana catesbeiana TaxID=8400 RepID=A0A2G9S557_AQUCT|nr:hypothetical protein AB205_0154870 [Aquarana catesbeiana]
MRGGDMICPALLFFSLQIWASHVTSHPGETEPDNHLRVWFSL